MGCGGSKSQNKANVLIEQLKEQFNKCDQELLKKQNLINKLQEENKINQIQIAEKEKQLLIKKKFELQNNIEKLQEQIDKTQSAYEKGKIAKAESEAIKEELENKRIIADIYKKYQGDQEKVNNLQNKIQEYEQEQQLNKIDGNQYQDPRFEEYLRENEQQLQAQVNGKLNPIQNKTDDQQKQLLDYPNLDTQFKPIEVNQQQNDLQKNSYRPQILYE